jgi:hypothetical protein
MTSTAHPFPYADAQLEEGKFTGRLVLYSNVFRRDMGGAWAVRGLVGVATITRASLVPVLGKSEDHALDLSGGRLKIREIGE